MQGKEGDVKCTGNILKSTRDCLLDMGMQKGFTPPLWHPAPHMQDHLTSSYLLEYSNCLLVAKPMQRLAIHCQDLIPLKKKYDVTLGSSLRTQTLTLPRLSPSYTEYEGLLLSEK